MCLKEASNNIYFEIRFIKTHGLKVKVRLSPFTIVKTFTEITRQ